MVPEGRRLFPSLTVMENLELGAFQPHCKRKRGDSLDRVFSIFPRLRERETPEGRNVVRRRTADGGHRPRADEPAEGADARRAVARARSGGGPRLCSTSSRTSTRRERPSYWSNRTSSMRFRSHRRPGCSKTVRSRCAERAPNCSRMKIRAGPISACDGRGACRSRRGRVRE